jgi:hypothetical protein
MEAKVPFLARRDREERGDLGGPDSPGPAEVTGEQVPFLASRADRVNGRVVSGRTIETKAIETTDDPGLPPVI